MRLLLLTPILFFFITANSWGFTAHKLINYYACFKLPIEMFGFYKMYIRDIEALATKADQRRYIKPDEGIGHFLDLDHYERTVPLDTLRSQWDTLSANIHIDSIKEHGVLPWRVLKVYYGLIAAFKSGDPGRIVAVSADLGHYVGDAHVPLHSTENYNGQLTNQHGIHGLWETRLPELFLDKYNFIDGKAKYISNPTDEILKIIEASYAAKDSVLHLEIVASEKFSSTKYSFENRGAQVAKVYSKEFSAYYHELLSGMVERRMKQAINSVASFWYSAWIEAGQPVLFTGPLKEIDLLKQVDSIHIDSVIKQPPKRTLIH
ncbi:S1/P1 Nuclease [bacterium]|nr:S1/P1 Nuclease [bacterium]